MLKNIKKIGILTIIVMLMLGIFNLTSVFAATTSLTATPSATKVKSGATFSVTVKSSVKLTGWTIALSDNGGCTFSNASGGELTGTSIFGTDLNGKTSLATYTFKAPTVTKDTKYTISFSGTAMCDEDTNELENTTCKTTITVEANETTTDKKDDEDKTTDKDTTLDKTTTDKKEETTTTPEQPKEKSNNAYLKTLGVRISDSLAKELGVKTNEYDFSGFSKDKTSYNVTVPKNVDSLKVVATAGENGTVKVTGNSGFEVGSNNKITIKVTSENGKTTKTYTIKVTKLAEEEEKPGNVIEDEKGVYLTSLKIDGVELVPEFEIDTYSYTAKVDSDKTEIDVKATANNEKAKIEISGNKELIEGENTINIVLTLDNSEEQKVYQIILIKEVAEISATIENLENNQANTTDLIGTVKKYIGIVIAVILFIIIAVIVLAVLLRRENKKINEEDEKLDKTNNREYDVYKNDENEFINNEIKKDNFIESLYKQRNETLDEEDLTQEEKETLEEINKQTEKIFEEKVEGQSVEHNSLNEIYEENPLKVRRKRRGKGKHSI